MRSRAGKLAVYWDYSLFGAIPLYALPQNDRLYREIRLHSGSHRLVPHVCVPSPTVPIELMIIQIKPT